MGILVRKWGFLLSTQCVGMAGVSRSGDLPCCMCLGCERLLLIRGEGFSDWDCHTDSLRISRSISVAPEEQSQLSHAWEKTARLASP